MDWECPWCGTDVRLEWGDPHPPYDTMLGAHVEDCDAYKREQGEMCTGDSYHEGN